MTTTMNVLGLGAPAAGATAIFPLSGGLSGGMLAVFRDHTTQTTLNLYYSADGQTGWTLVGSQANAAAFAFDATVDASNHLHVVYVPSDTLSVKYRKFTVSGTTWTAGSEESVASSAGAQTPAVECMNGANVLAVAWIEPASNNVAFAVRRTGGAWSSVFTEALATTNPSGYIIQPRLARGAAAVGAVQSFAFFASISLTNGKLGTKSVDFTAGTVSATNVISTSQAVPSSYGAGAGFYTMAGLAGPYAFVVGTVNSVGVEQHTAYLLSDTAVLASAATSGFTSGGFFRVEAMCATATEGRVALVNFSMAHVAVMEGSTVTWTPIFTWPAGGFLGWGVGNRNLGNKRAAVISNAGDNVYVTASSGELDSSTPLADSPASGATVATDTPTFSVRPHSPLDGVPKRARVEVGSSDGFSTVALALDQPASAYATPGSNISTSVSSAGNTVITQVGSPWWWHVRAMDIWGQLGDPSDDLEFTDSHPPLVTPLTPAAGASVTFGAGNIPFTWRVRAGDIQTKYQVIVERNSDGASVADSGLVTSAATTATLAISAAYKDVPLRWKVQLTDDSGGTGPYSEYHIFVLGDGPTVTITEPDTADTVDNPSPTVTWTVSLPGTRTQRTHVVQFNDSTTGALVHSSGAIAGSALSYTPATPILLNDVTYDITVTITDSLSFTGDDTVTDVLAAWTPPSAVDFEVDSAPYRSNGFVRITWTDAGKDADFYSWRVYRRVASDGAWVLLAETSSGLVNFEFDDYFALSGTTYDYAVIQGAYRFGAVVESDYEPLSSGLLQSTDYWLLHPTDPTKHMLIPIVTGDTYATEEESADLDLIGRGRKKDFGTNFGVRGSLTVQIRDHYDATLAITVKARVIKQTLETLQIERVSMYLRNPFGDLYKVALDTINISRVAGVGRSEYVDVTIPYAEVV